MEAVTGVQVNETKLMMSRPITELSRLIGMKWFRPLDKLAARADIPIGAVINVVEGRAIRPSYEKKLLRYHK
jgi:hypothetical protein